MKQLCKPWFQPEFVKFDFTRFKVERVAMDELYDFEIREAIFEHLVGLFYAKCPGEDCVEKWLCDQEPESTDCRSCPDNCYLTRHKSHLGVAFCVETWSDERSTRVFLS